MGQRTGTNIKSIRFEAEDLLGLDDYDCDRSEVSTWMYPALNFMVLTLWL